MTLSGRTAIVTGAGGTGCGRAISLRLGAHVIVSETNVSGGEETVQLIKASGNSAEFREADIRREGDVRKLVSLAHGDLGLPVNNASGSFSHRFDMDHWSTPQCPPGRRPCPDLSEPRGLRAASWAVGTSKE